jgi:hypothetical protein
MLRSHDRIDNGGEIVHVGKGLYTKDDVIEGTVSVYPSIFWVSDDCEKGKRRQYVFAQYSVSQVDGAAIIMAYHAGV